VITNVIVKIAIGEYENVEKVWIDVSSFDPDELRKMIQEMCKELIIKICFVTLVTEFAKKEEKERRR